MTTMITEDHAVTQLHEACEDLRGLLKNADVGAVLASRGVNISLALVAVDAVEAYIRGERERAADDFATVAEEVASRLASHRA